MNLGYVHTDRLQYNTETDTGFYEHALFIDISVYCRCSPRRYSSRSRYRFLSVWTHLYCKCRIVTDTDVLTTIKKHVSQATRLDRSSVKNPGR